MFNYRTGVPASKFRAQRDLADLAARQTRELLHELDALGTFVPGNQSATMHDELRLRYAVLRLEDHDALDRFSPFGVGHTDDGCIGDGSVRHESFLDLAAIHVLAA